MQAGILNEIEDVSDNLMKQRRKEGGKQAVNIGFYDIGQMSPLTQVGYLLMILMGLFGVLLYFYWKLVTEKEEEAKKKDAKRAAKKEKNKKK